MERATASELFREPGHPYTAGLLRAMPRLDKVSDRLTAIEGVPPDLRSPPAGCPFEPRCSVAVESCRTDAPELAVVRTDRHVACYRPFEVTVDDPRSDRDWTPGTVSHV
jgi:oligopeptide/dipeptide ABC transporter ATP-binding protein